MIAVDIPGFGELRLLHLVCDYNVTLAVDGRLLPGAGEALARLAGDLAIHVVTADTFGQAAVELRGLPVELAVLSGDELAAAKREFVGKLGAASVVALGNGRNDVEMLDEARVGIGLVQAEGAAAVCVAHADIVAVDVLDALALLQSPTRLVATLRS